MSFCQILLIEDSPSDADHVLECLEEAAQVNNKACCVVTDWVSSLKEGIEKLSQKNYQLVLLDLGLPDSFGIDSVRRLLDVNFDIPVVVLTGDISDELWMSSLHAGAQDYLIKKDISPQTLFKTISHSIERFKLKLELKKAVAQLEVYSQKLAKSNRDLEEFAFIASHDLQEPLRTMISFSSRIEESTSDLLSLKNKEYLSRIQRAGSRMQNLLDDLLEYSRINSENQVKSQVSIKEVFNDIWSDLELVIKESSASIVVSDNKKIVQVSDRGNLNSRFLNDCDFLPDIFASQSQMRRLFENLISNSIKYAKKDTKPQIQIKSLRGFNDNWVISVEDNGIGFDEKYKTKIFEQFQRLHGASDYEGTGMGLASVKKIIENYDGAIDVKSNLDQGSVFTVSLPLIQKASFAI